MNPKQALGSERTKKARRAGGPRLKPDVPQRTSAATSAQDFWHRFRRNRVAVASSWVLITLYIIMIFAPLIEPYDPNQIDLDLIYAPPSLAHPLGADDLGRDVLSRLLAGSRISLTVGLLAMAGAIALGISVGAAAGFFGGHIDSLLMRFTDIMLSFPQLPLLLILAALMGASLGSVALFIAVFSWMNVARLVRAEFLALKEMEFVDAARATGAGTMRLINVHLLRNSLAPVIVAGTLGVATAVLTESALSFLGFGIQPPDASWGNMLAGAQATATVAPLLAIAPGFLITLTVLCFNYLGDGLRDAWDPNVNELGNR